VYILVWFSENSIDKSFVRHQRAVLVVYNKSETVLALYTSATASRSGMSCWWHFGRRWLAGHQHISGRKNEQKRSLSLCVCVCVCRGVEQRNIENLTSSSFWWPIEKPENNGTNGSPSTVEGWWDLALVVSKGPWWRRNEGRSERQRESPMSSSIAPQSCCCQPFKYEDRELFSLSPILISFPPFNSFIPLLPFHNKRRDL